MANKTKTTSSSSHSSGVIYSKDEDAILTYIKEQSKKELDPLLLKESAGKESCCIFRIPERLAEVNPEAYKPKVVSIGPYHYGEKHLQMIQEHKPRFRKLFLDKAREKNVEENVLFKAVMDLKETITTSYSEELRKTSSELVHMMILDGCFILMLLLIESRVIDFDKKEDPIFTIPWILPSIKSDLLFLENQVPFSVLKTLLEISKIDISGDVNRMVYPFFNSSIDIPERNRVSQTNFEAKHLLDLIRKTFIPTMGESETTSTSATSGVEPKTTSSSSKEFILSAKRLRLRGIKFRIRSDADSVLDIRLQKNRLQIPLLRFDEFISPIFLNCVAYEQFYTKSTNHITSYVVFMGCLLKGEEDAAFLSNDKEIIENYFGSENEVSQFFKNISKDVVFDISKSYLRNEFEGVNKYTSKWYNRVWAGFRHTHFESPWTCLSSFAVIFVILLTMLQSTVAILSYLNDKKDDGNAPPPLRSP
ncbi:hypothetical protein EUTSA_v10010335mg [Eutrema salsugineum]|uniref:Uncharacterized protein n=1 Tax=Eutrema salsugineum TaxID=72664 RepID=V4L686_EUTSA|nr:UPF0481 protein At3g47200 [Eutrema salsugineum]ESQ45855.1 hypothetical protein EUTSA_v10010335mg [Eutrema salsugineum]